MAATPLQVRCMHRQNPPVWPEGCRAAAAAQAPEAQLRGAVQPQVAVADRPTSLGTNGVSSHGGSGRSVMIIGVQPSAAVCRADNAACCPLSPKQTQAGTATAGGPQRCT